MRAYLVGPCTCCHGWTLYRYGAVIVSCRFDYYALAAACDELNQLTLFEHTGASGRILAALNLPPEAKRPRLKHRAE